MFKVMEGKIYNQEISYPARLSFRLDIEIKG